MIAARPSHAAILRPRHPRTRTFGAALSAVLSAAAFGASACAGSVPFGYLKADGTIAPTSMRASAPAISGQTLDGTNLALSSFVGAPLVVNYWGSWCGPCRAEAPTLAAARSATAELGVRFVGLDTRDTNDLARAFVKHYGLGYPSIVDADGSLQARFTPLPSSGAPPVTILIDRRGRVAARIIGEARLSQLLDDIRALAAEPA